MLKLRRAAQISLAVLAVALAGCDGCDDRVNASPAIPAGLDAAPPPAAPSARGASDGGTDAGPSAAPDRGELRVLKLVFTSDVKDREPVDDLKSAKPGQRVWAHLTVRNRGASSRTVTLVFLVNGTERSRVDLNVEPSWSFRTFAYNTLRKTDTGALKVEVRDDAGAVMDAKTIPIVKDKDDEPPKPVPLDPKKAPAPFGD